MNTSILITRYARALTKYVQETGHGAIVCSEAERLAEALGRVPDLGRMVSARDVVTAHEKKTLLRTALGQRMSQEMERFVDLLIRNGRIGYLQDILRDFVDMYHRSMGIRQARLVCSAPPSEALLQRLKALVASRFQSDVRIDVTVDPALIGGFVFDIDDYMIDTSVARQLEVIRKEFIEQNKRIV